MYLEKYQHLYELSRQRVPEPDIGQDILRLQRNEKPNNWPKDMLDQIFSNVPDHLLQRYPDPLSLYGKLADFLGVTSDKLLLTSGVDEAIRSVITLSCEPGDIFCVTWPGYAMYDVYARMFECRLTPITYTPDQFMDPQELCSFLPEKTKVLFLPNPSQPVENCFDLEGLTYIAKYCRERKIVFAVDEAYYLFGAPTAAPLIDEFENLLVMRSFSKAFGAASIRLGYVIGGPEALTPLSAMRLAHEANALSLHTASMLLDCYDSHVDPSIQSIRQGRDFLRTQAIEHGLRAWGEVSNYVLIDLGTPERMQAAVMGLETRGMYVKGKFPEPLDQHIMVTCGNKDIMERFFQALMDSLEEATKGR